MRLQALLDKSDRPLEQMSRSHTFSAANNSRRRLELVEKSIDTQGFRSCFNTVDDEGLRRPFLGL